MPKITLSDDEYDAFLEFRGKRHASPDRVLAGFLDQIRAKMELAGWDVIEFAKRVDMQSSHLRKVLSTEKPSDPKFTTIVKIANGLNLTLRLENLE